MKNEPILWLHLYRLCNLLHKLDCYPNNLTINRGQHFGPFLKRLEKVEALAGIDPASSG